MTCPGNRYTGKVTEPAVISSSIPVLFIEFDSHASREALHIAAPRPASDRRARCAAGRIVVSPPPKTDQNSQDGDRRTVANSEFS